MSYQDAARRANGSWWGDAYYEDQDDRASDDLNNELWDRLHELMRGDGILVTLLRVLEEVTDDRGDREDFRDLLPMLKFDYMGHSSRFGDADRAIERAFRDVPPRSEEIVARRHEC